MATFSELEKSKYRPLCPNCGSKNVRVRWLLATGLLETGERQWVPGEHRCRDCRGALPPAGGDEI